MNHPSFFFSTPMIKSISSRLFLISYLILLTSCSSLLTPAEPVTSFAPSIQSKTANDWPQVSWQLVIMRPNAPQLVDSLRINVRPNADELQVYQGVRWAQPAPDLFESALLRTFEDSNKIGAVARSGSNIMADYRLLTDIRRFEAAYPQGDSLPTVIIEVHTKLLDRSNRVVASQTFLQQVSVTSKDIPVVVSGFEQALTQVTQQIAGWTLREGQRSQ